MLIQSLIWYIHVGGTINVSCIVQLLLCPLPQIKSLKVIFL